MELYCWVLEVQCFTRCQNTEAATRLAPSLAVEAGSHLKIHIYFGADHFPQQCYCYKNCPWCKCIFRLRSFVVNEWTPPHLCLVLCQNSIPCFFIGVSTAVSMASACSPKFKTTQEVHQLSMCQKMTLRCSLSLSRWLYCIPSTHSLKMFFMISNLQFILSVNFTCNIKC